MVQEDRFSGCMLGIAIGDALGMPVEGLNALEIKSSYGRVEEMMPAPSDHFHAGLKAGQYTDDTEESLILASSLLDSLGFSGDDFSSKLSTWGSNWITDERFNRGVGFATRLSIESMISGVSWQNAGVDIPTCGSAMRVAPIGLLYHRNLDLVSRYAELSSIPTHRAAAARAGAVSMAVGVALAVQGFRPSFILDTAVYLSGKVSSDFAMQLKSVKDLLLLDVDHAFGSLGTSPDVFDTVPAAFYSFMKFDPCESLIFAASLGGDTDSIASMTGALAGAAFGTSWIPDKWLDPLENRELIISTAIELSRLCDTISLI